MILAGVPASARDSVAPLIPNIVAAIHDAFSIALASSFLVGVFGAILGFAIVAFLPEAPMRVTFEQEDPLPAAPAAGDGQTVEAPRTAGESRRGWPFRRDKSPRLEEPRPTLPC